MYYRTNGFLSWGPCRPHFRYSHYRVRMQVFNLQVRPQTNAPSFNPHLSHNFPWYSWTSSLNYIVHWTICQDLDLCNWSYTCYTCLWLHFNYLVFLQKLHICILVPSMLHVHYNCIASPNQKVCILGWFKKSHEFLLT